MLFSGTLSSCVSPAQAPCLNRKSTIHDKLGQKLDPLAAHTALAASLKALSHPARLEILRVLAERGSCICGEVVEVLPLAQSTVSQHLKVLREAGIVRGEVEGPKSCYCLDPKIIAEVRRDLDELFAFLSSSCPPATMEKPNE